MDAQVLFRLFHTKTTQSTTATTSIVFHKISRLHSSLRDFAIRKIVAIHKKIKNFVILKRSATHETKNPKKSNANL